MIKKKKTLYEILEVSPSAPLAEIKAAHERLSRQLVSGKSGMSREDTDFQLKVIDVALQTLSVQSSRDAYDAQLAPLRAPANAIVQPSGIAAPLGSDAKPFKIAAAIKDNQRISEMAKGGHQIPLKMISSTVTGTASALKQIIRVVIILTVLAAVMQIVSAVSSSRRTGHDASKADEKLYIQEYNQKYGVRVGSRAEGELLEAQMRREENEQRATALEKQRQEEEYRRFVEESARIGAQAAEQARRGEARARYEEEQQQRQLDEAKRRQEEAEQEAERNRIEDERRKLGLH